MGDLTDQTELTTFSGDEVFYVVDDDDGTPVPRKVTIENLRIGLGAPQFVLKTSDESVTSSTTPQDDDALFIAVGTNQKWWCEFEVLAVGNTAGDIQFAVTVPTGATVIANHNGLAPTSSGNSGNYKVFATETSGSAMGGAALITSSAPWLFRVCVYVETAGTSGNIQLQWAQDVSNAAATTVKAGSLLKAYRIA